MRSINRLTVLALVLCCLQTGFAQENGGLIKQLQPLLPFVGKTWRGVFTNSTPEKSMIDISRWERALNGQAIRALHSINDGVYGGETIIVWDLEKDSLVYYYFTTAGFYTHGTMTIEGSKIHSYEKVTGSQAGITAVKATTEMLPDGRFHATSKYLKNGNWVPGHEAYYTQAPEEKVVFK